MNVLLTQARRARDWLESNPDKPRSRLKSFFNGWMERYERNGTHGQIPGANEGRNRVSKDSWREAIERSRHVLERDGVDLDEPAEDT